MANVDNDVTPSFRVTPSCILIVSLWLVVVLCPPINVLKLPTLTSVYFFFFVIRHSFTIEDLVSAPNLKLGCAVILRDLCE